MIETILACLFLSSVAVNFLHWRRQSGERFFYFPGSGWLRTAFVVWSIASAIAAASFLACLVPAVAFLLVSICFGIASELYSIWCRQTKRRQMT